MTVDKCYSKAQENLNPIIDCKLIQETSLSVSANTHDAIDQKGQISFFLGPDATNWNTGVRATSKPTPNPQTALEGEEPTECPYSLPLKH